ncbi:hypothetical protein HY522_04415 [bacterium]|nr:hypothetical protein [bacterium]
MFFGVDLLPASVRDGGSARILGMADYFSTRKGSRVRGVYHSAPSPGCGGRACRYASGVLCWVADMIFGRADLVIMNYPNFPVLRLWFSSLPRGAVYGFWSPRWLFLIGGLCLFVIVRISTWILSRQLILDVDDLPSMEPESPLRRSAYSRRTAAWVERILFRRVDRIWVVSDAEGAKIVQTFGVPARNIRTVVTGRPRRDIRPRVLPPGGFRFVYAGAMDRIEIREMVRSFQAAPRRDVELWLCGIHGEWTEELRADDRIHYLGVLDDVEAESLVAACDVSLLPYGRHVPYYDTVQPAKLALSIVARTPVLAGDSPALSRVVGALDVGLVCPNNEWTESMGRLPERRMDLARWRENCERHREIFYWDSILTAALDG